MSFPSLTLQALQLSQFRKLPSWVGHFEPLTVLVGPNGSGKTSILEAIYMLSTGKSFRAGAVAEMVAFDHEYGRVKAKMQDASNEEIELELLLTTGMVQGKKARSVLYTVNGVGKRQRDFVGKLLAVVFRPEDMRLVEGSPARRRGYLDEPLSLQHPEYASSLKTYGQALLKRNKLLPKVRDGEMPKSVLSYFTLQVLKHGQIIQEYRRAYAKFCNQVAFSLPMRFEYVPSVMSQERLDTYSRQELAAGHTLVGPHKDDFLVQLPLVGALRDLSAYGSRGQQRMAVLWLKLVEWQYLFEKSGERPILLLDDIFSELDHEHGQLVEKLMQQTQTIVSSADNQFEEKIEHLHPKIVKMV